MVYIILQPAFLFKDSIPLYKIATIPYASVSHSRATLPQRACDNIWKHFWFAKHPTMHKVVIQSKYTFNHALYWYNGLREHFNS
jgi:hypothetical protein